MLQLSFLMETIILAGMKKGGSKRGIKVITLVFVFITEKGGSYWRFSYSRSRNNFSQGHFGQKKIVIPCAAIYIWQYSFVLCREKWLDLWY